MEKQAMNSQTKLLRATEGAAIAIRGASCVATMHSDFDRLSDPASLNNLGLLRDVDIVIRNGKFSAVGKGEAAKAASWKHQSESLIEVDGRGLTFLPGLVDSHAHPIFGGSRAHETVMKSQGMTYEAITKAGGGIASTMRATREASDGELKRAFHRNAQRSLLQGVVLLEAKTGYGLNPEQELRLFRLLLEASNDGLDLPCIAPTVLGPHAASPEHRGLDSYIQALVDALPKFLAAYQELKDPARHLRPAVDIFVERDYFTAGQGERWLGAAMQYGFDVHLHADEFSRSGGSELAIALARRNEQAPARKAAEARLLSIDHGQYATESDLEQLSRHGVTAIALPATSHFSNIPYVEAGRWRRSGIAVAIASDFNPGSAPINNLWFSAFLALTRCGFSVAEVLLGITKHAAMALGAQGSFGEIEVGRRATLVGFRGTEPEEFFASAQGDHLEVVVHGGC